MDRAMRQADRASGKADSDRHLLLQLPRRAGRRDIDGFFEERAVQRIGFVEERQHVERPMIQDSFDRELAALHEALDQRVVVRLMALVADVRRLQDTAQPIERADELRQAVRSHDAAAPREGERLHNTGERHRAQERPGIGGHRCRQKPRHGQAGGAQRFPRAALVPGHGGGFGAVTRQSQGCEDAGTDHGRPVSHGQHAVERTGAGCLEHDRGRRSLVVEPDGDRAVHPRVLEHVAPVGPEDQIDADPLRRIAEGARLVARGRGQEEHTGHQSKWSCSGFGSAQQYQGSLR